MARWVFEPLFIVRDSDVVEYILEGNVVCLVLALFGVLLWAYNKRVGSCFSSPIWLLSHCLFVGSLALLLVFMGSASTSQMIGVFATCLGGAWVVSFFQKNPPQILILLSTLEIFFCFYAYCYVDVGGGYLLILSLSLLAPYILRAFPKELNIIFQLSLVSLAGLCLVATPLLMAFFSS